VSNNTQLDLQKTVLQTEDRQTDRRDQNT